MSKVSVKIPQFSVGIISDSINEIKIDTEVYELDKEGWFIQVIKGRALSDIIPYIDGEYFIVLEEEDALCCSELFSVYEIMGQNPNAGGYVYRRSDGETSFRSCYGTAAFRTVFLQSVAKGDMLLNMKIMHQLDIVKWLEALKNVGNAYVMDYEADCCAYLISLATPIILGNLRLREESNKKYFQFRFEYFDGLTDLLTQWMDLIDNKAILECYTALLTASFDYLTIVDYKIAYISDTQIEQVRDFLLENARKVSVQWQVHGISTEAISDRVLQAYDRFVQSPHLSRILEKMFYRLSGYPLRLDEPRTFNQKINWMKLYDSQEIKTVLCDKYAVRVWIREKLGEKYLIPLIGVWDKAEDIDFDCLPDKFVLKVNQGSGFNIIVTDKRSLDKSEAIRQLNEWMKIDYCTYYLEMQYKDIKPQIICEEYVENNGEGLHDYKIHVFNGEPQYIQYISGRANKARTAERWFDTQWNPQDFTYTNPKLESFVEKPQSLNELLRVAKTLGKEFAYVRVDLYVLNDGQIKFGEMTFSPMSGMDQWKPKEMDLIMGEKINIEKLWREIKF